MLKRSNAAQEIRLKHVVVVNLVLHDVAHAAEFEMTRKQL